MKKTPRSSKPVTPEAGGPSRQTEDALHKSEEWPKVILKAAMDGVWVADIQGCLLEVNEAYCRMSGYTEQELLTMHISDLEAVETTDDVERHMREIIAQGEVRFETLHRRKDGTVYDVEVSAQYRAVEGGRIITFLRDISDRKEGETRLAERNQFIESIINNTPDILYIYDILEKRNIYSNDGIQKILGYTVEEIQEMGESIIPLLMHPDDFKEYLKKIIPRYATARDKEQIIHQYRMKHKNGEWHWLFSNETIYLRQPDGTPKQIFGMIHDITESKQAESALRESEERFRKIFEETTLGIVTVLPSFLFEKVNPAFCRMLGYTEDELRTMKFTDITHPDYIDHDIENVKKVRDGEIPFYQVEKRYIQKSGKLIWGNIIVSCIRDKQGTFLYFLCMINDITEHIQAEEALIKSEALLKTQFDHSPDIIMILDREFRIVSINKVLFTNNTVKGMIGKDAVQILPEKVQPQIRERLRECFETGAIQQFEHLVVEDKWAQARIVPLTTGSVIDKVMIISTDITERKRAELLLQAKTEEIKARNEELAQSNKEMQKAKEHAEESEEKYRALYNSMSDALFVTELNDDGTLSNFTMVNDIACESLGYTREELLSKSPADINSENTKLHLGSSVHKILNEKIKIVEHEHVTKDGRIIPVEISSNFIRYKDRTIFNAIARDITERKRSEEALKQKEEQLRLLSDNLPNGLVYQIDTGEDDQQRRFTYIGAGVKKLHRVSQVEVLKDAMTIYGQVLEEDRQMIIDREKYAIANMIPFSAEVRVRLPSGEIRWRLFASAPRRLSNNHLIWDGIEIDITELKQTAENLIQSEEKYRTLIDNINAGVFQSTLTGEFLHINSTVAKITGYENTAELMSKPVTCLYADLNDRELLKNILLNEGEVKGLELKALKKDGTSCWVSMSAVLQRDKNGRPDKILGIIHDISERKQAEKEKVELEARLQQAQKMESIGRLAGGIAHDFNNMLGVILGNAEMALSEVQPEQPLYSDLIEIKKAAERSADLTRQLLAFARKQTIAPKVLDLNSIVAGMMKMLDRLIGDNVHLNWQPGANLWSVKMDPSQFDQILVNLCVNASNAISDVGEISIMTENRILDAESCANIPDSMPGEYVKITVLDNGHGMDRQTLARIFEPFFTTKSLGSGTGLGLATVYGAVKQNNGFINVESTPGKGTAFGIYLPRSLSKVEQATRSESSAQLVGSGQETILLVEDERALLSLITRILQKKGYTVLTAESPGAAIKLAREYPGDIHLLITDVIMPEMNGRDLAKNILSLYPNLKRLFMSGYTADVIAHHGVLEQGVFFIQKPLTQKELLDKIQEVLDHT